MVTVTDRVPFRLNRERIGSMKPTVPLLLLTLLSVGLGMHTPKTPNYIFLAGSEGYACFRIPAIVMAPDGAVLAFAEGRKNGCSDTGDIDLVMKRSTDGGRTWGALRLVWSDAENTQGNPAPVVDRKTGTIFLLSTWNLGTDYEPLIINRTSKDTRRVFVLSSENNGITWTEPKEITSSVKLPDWTWYATGPGSGIQITRGEHAGRLMVACDHIEAETKNYYSHVIFSDDHGQTWQLGGVTPQHFVNESEVAELENGSLLLNMRNYKAGEKHRKISRSYDGGLSWTDLESDSILVEPICQASLHRYQFADEGESILLFSNPASKIRRENMTLRVSFDDGETWPKKLLVHSGMAAYSDIVRLPDDYVGLLYEAGADHEHAYTGIAFRRISLDELE